MDFFSTPADFMSLASAALLLLLTTNKALDVTAEEEITEANPDDFTLHEQLTARSISELEAFSRAALFNFRLSNMYYLLDEELHFWMKPRSTAWFSRFLLEQYDDERWLRIFRLTKPAVVSLAELLKPTISKKNTNYRLAIPVLVRVCCALFKLSHGSSLLVCSELFAVGRSTVSLVLREVVQAINIALRGEIAWPTGPRLLETEAEFKCLYGLPGIVGTIDGTHVSISKPRYAPADYFYFKSGGFTLNCQAVVDSKKRFLDLYFGMPGSTNDSRVLRRSSLYHKAMQNTLWDDGASFQGFIPYLLGDSGYPILPWLMVPHRGQANLPLAESLFNKKLRRGRGVVENAFGILKLSFRELLGKSDLNVTFLPDVITACTILHNVMLGQSHSEVETLLQFLREEDVQVAKIEEEAGAPEVLELARNDVGMRLAMQKRRDLSVFLALQRLAAT